MHTTLHTHTQAEDKVWADLSVEMAEVALLVAEGVWDELLTDTAQGLRVLEQQQQQQMGGGGGGGAVRQLVAQLEQQSAGLLPQQQGQCAVEAQ